MSKSLLFAAVWVTLISVAGCGSADSGPTADIEACLKKAGARIASEARDVAFATPDGTRVVEKSGSDRSDTLSTGSYRGSTHGGWVVFYVVRKGMHLSLAPITRNPETAAKVIAYVKPYNGAVAAAAYDCL